MMQDYFFIQSQEQFTDVRTRSQYDLALSLAKSGKAVSILLVQNAVLSARKKVDSPNVDALLSHAVKIYADSLSLQQREISPQQLNTSIKPAQLDIVISAMLNGDKVIWW
ncbi:DsrE family protein [Methylobacillus caricis]|uniref:DsrE family protein n=1 Tax=Methylobacillus caricis TaxID=1971611 RepID=UPI001CFFB064|nr:DsrE family protein [Methylobacillus caricis]MCB5186644.1 DsrE family protein [Methylobacillus caricis]